MRKSHPLTSGEWDFPYLYRRDSYFNVTLIIVKLLAGTLIVIFF